MDCFYNPLQREEEAFRNSGCLKMHIRQQLGEIKYQILGLRGKKVFLKRLITIHSQPKSGVELWRYSLIILVLSRHQDFYKVSEWRRSTLGICLPSFHFCDEYPHNSNKNLKKSNASHYLGKIRALSLLAYFNSVFSLGRVFWRLWKLENLHLEVLCSSL